MKFSKVLFAIAALCAVSTVTPSSYLERAKAKAKAARDAAQGYYDKAKGVYTSVGGTEGLQGYYDQAQGAYTKAQDMYGKYQNYRGTPTAAERAAEEANMAEMNAYAAEQGLGTE
jgi:hypothetical protein